MCEILALQNLLILQCILKYLNVEELKKAREVNSTFAVEATLRLRSRLVYIHFNPVKPLLNLCNGDNYYLDLFSFINTNKLSPILCISFLNYPMVNNHENKNPHFNSLPPDDPYVIRYWETIDIGADPRQMNDVEFCKSLTSETYFPKIIPFIKELRLEFNFLKTDDLVTFANFLHLLSPHLTILCLDVASWFKEDAEVILTSDLDRKLDVAKKSSKISTLGFRVLRMHNHYDISVNSLKILLGLFPVLKFLDSGGFEQFYQVFEPNNKIPVCLKAILELGHWEGIEGLKIVGASPFQHSMDARDLVLFTEKVKVKELHIHIYKENGLQDLLQNLAGSLETLNIIWNVHHRRNVKEKKKLEFSPVVMRAKMKKLTSLGIVGIFDYLLIDEEEYYVGKELIQILDLFQVKDMMSVMRLAPCLETLCLLFRVEFPEKCGVREEDIWDYWLEGGWGTIGQIKTLVISLTASCNDVRIERILAKFPNLEIFRHGLQQEDGIDYVCEHVRTPRKEDGCSGQDSSRTWWRIKNLDDNVSWYFKRYFAVVKRSRAEMNDGGFWDCPFA